jgi:hypothetical protein
LAREIAILDFIESVGSGFFSFLYILPMENDLEELLELLLGQSQWSVLETSKNS